MTETPGDRAGPGNLTFLFTDIEGSTPKWEYDPETMRRVLERHDRILKGAIETSQGRVVHERGEGDSFFAVFQRASDAVRGAIACQLALAAEEWPEGWQPRVRMAIHTGEADTELRGTDVNRCARLRSLAHGDQILVSSSTVALVRDHVEADTTFQNLGEHKLRGLGRPERVYQVRYPGLPADFPPLPESDQERHTNLPTQRSPAFIGREPLMEVLRQGEPRPSEHAPTVIALTGTGGIGKTAIALQYARSRRTGVSTVWWIDASEEAGATADLASLALHVGLETNQLEVESVVSGLHEWLASRGEWLLVFDNAENPGALAPLIPPAGTGQVIVTSRYPDWSQFGKSVEVLGLDRVEATALLRRGWPDAAEGVLDDLADRLGGHPLALWQAIAYAHLSGIEATAYLEMLQAHMSELLERGPLPTDYPTSAAAAVTLAVEALPRDAPLAPLLLGTLSYMGSSPAPRVILRALSHPEEFGRPPGGPGDLEVMDAIAVLRGRSLISGHQGGAVSVHPVVAAVVRSRLDLEDPTSRGHPLHLGLHVIDAALTRSGELPRIRDGLGLIDHAVSVGHRATERGVALEEAYELLRLVANYLMEIGERRLAVGEYRRLLDLAVSVYGPDSVENAGALNNLGIALQALKQLEEAEGLLRGAVGISRRGGSDRVRELAVQLGNLALVLFDRGEVGTALQAIDEAIRLMPQERHADRAMGQAKKARILLGAGRTEEAIQMFDEAESRLLEDLDPSLSNLLFVLQGKARAEIQAGLLGEARKTLEEAVDRAERQAGLESRIAIEFLVLLMNVLLELRDFGAIQAWLARAPGLLTAWQG